MSNILSLDDLRGQIDALDSQLLGLFNDRAKLAEKVAQVKLAEGEQTDFYRPDREALVLRRIQEANPGPLKDEDVARLYRELMSSCLALEKPLTVAYLGPEGTYTQEASLKHFGRAINMLPTTTISDIFQEVENGSAHYGVVPVENSSEGVVNHTLDRLMNSTLQICGEVELRINHHLLSKSQSLTDISVVYAHQQALGQCRGWLQAHLPQVKTVAVSSNAEGAKRALAENGAASIAGEIASQVYGLNKLASSIEDANDNTTRFFVLGTKAFSATNDDKTSLLISTKNEAGALQKIISPLADAGISMSRIESRPSKQGTWEYVFFIDIDGHQDDQSISEALNVLKSNVNSLKVLGSYPRAVF